MKHAAHSALSLLLASVLAGVAVGAEPSPGVSFDRVIRPILSDTCFKCHGPDAAQRQAGLRLDERASALAPAESGKLAVVPSHADESELVRRIRSTDPDEQMPPPDSGKKLTDAQRQLLADWVAAGADYTRHWSFVAPRKPPLPGAEDAWARNPIDRFVYTALQAKNLETSPEADQVTLIRRLSLDLTGLPPTPAEVDAFLSDTGGGAYDALVDRLLASPHYGERMALEWLDAARFADTHGYHIDCGRDMTRWREWVIDAFNANKPFNEFTVEQLAGDLLPEATLEQRIASGFNRNHMINFEGGAIPEEYHTAYIVDRVNTTSTVWLGLTVACSQCHDHKYDPLTQREYYGLFAFFHNVPENGLDGSKGNAAPTVPAPTREQQTQLGTLSARIAELEPQAKDGSADLRAELEKLVAERAAIEKSAPTTMVMQELPSPRDTFVLLRGQYDQRGAPVTAGVPASLPPLPAGAPANRLSLARWLVDPDQPLTARVIVNRYWQMYFGTGIVKTSEDFGSQGEYPSHPELLDWLAADFIESGWDVKRMQRLIVTSATYRQTSRATPEAVRLDPDNRLLARGPRLRLPAEFIRDQALAAAGLLDPRIGGRSVSPYQPPGLWEELMSRDDGANWTAQKYTQDHGPDLYRRTMYTFWKRTSPPATLSTFDAPDRETCTVRRARTNTPLQALVLLNDPTYVEAARKLAERMLAESGPSPAERIDRAFRLVLARGASQQEREVLRQIFERQLAAFRQDAAAVDKLLAVGESAVTTQFDRAELAAWAMVASVILNLDETLTKG